MADFGKLRTTLAYARLGLVSLAAATVPITVAAQELCGTDMFEGEPDAADLMNRTVEFLDILEANGVVAFQGAEGRISIGAARQSLREGYGSATLLSCVVDSESIEFESDAGNVVVGCRGLGAAPSLFQAYDAEFAQSAGRLFCSSELASISPFLVGSEA